MICTRALLKIRFSLLTFFISFLIITIGNWFLKPDTAASQERKVYYLVDSEIYDELQTEISQFIVDVSLDTNSQSKLIIFENQSALEIRQILRNAYNTDNLWGAFLIGRIAPAYKQIPGYGPLLSDHPYISYDCPYTDEDADGVFEAASNFSIIPACMPDIWISRIYPSREGEEGINQIRSYLNKNHLLRNDGSYFEKKMFYHNSIGIAEEGLTYDDFNNIFSDFLTDHPLFTLDDVTISSDAGVYDQIDSFFNGFESSYEIMNINSHGLPNLLAFEECDIISPTQKNCFFVDVTSVELAEKVSHVKLVDLDSCSNGNFITPNYFAGEALFSGDTLLVIANPEATGYFSGALEEKFRTSYYSLGLGFSFADLYTYIDPGHPRHFFGDPTITFRQKNLNNTPILSINGTTITEPGKYELDFGRIGNESSRTITLNFSNNGGTELKIFGRWVQHYVSYDETSSPGSTNGFIFSITDPTYLNLDFEEVIQPGVSKELKFTFNPNANNDEPGSSNYKGVFKFMTNDPNVGSFQIITVGDHIIFTDTDNDNMPDDWEQTYFNGISRDGNSDYDNDNLTDLDEYWNETNPTLEDTDSDGMPDGWEVQYDGLDPLVDDSGIDSDSDGFTNLEEFYADSNPFDNSDFPLPPVATAGVDQTVDEGLVVTLNGANSQDPDNDIESYEWTQVGEPTVVLSNSSAVSPTFTAPDVGPDGISLTFNLKVTDKVGLYSEDTCIINIGWLNEAPVADAGETQTVDEGDNVILDGSNSSDVDDGIASYSWIQTSGTNVALIDAASIYPSFTAPDVGTAGTALTFELTVTDNGGLKHTDTCIVNVSWVNAPPVASAGVGQTVIEGETVTLNAANSSDPDDGIGAYLWTQAAGPNVTFSNPADSHPTFITPPVGLEGTALTFKLTVTDNGGLKSEDTVSVTVNDNGISTFPENVLTFSTSTDQDAGCAMEEGGSIVALDIIEPSMITDTLNRPQNLIYGLMDFTFKTDVTGGTVRVTIYLPSSAPAGYTWYKYSTTGGWIDFGSNASFNTARDQVTLTLTDGGAGDDDGVANGIIIDPSGLGSAPPVSTGGGSTNTTSDEGGGGGGGGGIFGTIDLAALTGYHLDWFEKDGTAVYMPVTDWIRALKGAQTHVESFAPGLARFIREQFDALERKAKTDQDGFLSTAGTYMFPVFGKVAEMYLDAVDSHELMDNAYKNTTISVDEFNKLNKQGDAISSHTVEGKSKL